MVTTHWIGPNGTSDTLVAPPGATLDVQPNASGAAVTVTPASQGSPSASSSLSTDSVTTTASTTCYNGDNGLSIADGCVYDSYANTFCAQTSCTHFGFQQTMIQNVKGAVYVAQSLNATVTNNGSQNAQYGAVYDEWPGSTGDVVVQYSPQSILNELSGTISVSLGIPPFFSFSQSEPFVYAQTGYDFAHGAQNPAFGAFWQAWSGHFGTPGTGISSANEVHIGAGQSDLADVVQVDY